MQTGTGSCLGFHHCNNIDISAPRYNAAHTVLTLDCSTCARADPRCVVEAIRQLARLHFVDCVLHQIESMFPRVPRLTVFSRKHWVTERSYAAACSGSAESSLTRSLAWRELTDCLMLLDRRKVLPVPKLGISSQVVSTKGG